MRWKKAGDHVINNTKEKASSPKSAKRYNSESNEKTHISRRRITRGRSGHLYLLIPKQEKGRADVNRDKEESDPVPEQEPTPKKENLLRSIFDDD